MKKAKKRSSDGTADDSDSTAELLPSPSLLPNPVLNAGAGNFLPPIKPKRVGCLCCGSNTETHLPLDTVLCQGFGGWMITRNNELFFMDDGDKEWEDFKTLEFIEKKAKRDSKANWMAINDTPLHGEKYQRQRGKWVLVEENAGFA